METLRKAAEYIRVLQNILENDGGGSSGNNASVGGGINKPNAYLMPQRPIHQSRSYPSLSENVDPYPATNNFNPAASTSYYPGSAYLKHELAEFENEEEDDDDETSFASTSEESNSFERQNNCHLSFGNTYQTYHSSEAYQQPVPMAQSQIAPYNGQRFESF